jgi:hypothetical protein
LNVGSAAAAPVATPRSKIARTQRMVMPPP